MAIAAKDFPPALVTDGKLPPPVSNAIRGLLRRMEGKRVVVSVREWKKKRSLKQNRFYFDAVLDAVIAVFREHGTIIDKEEAHEFVQVELLKRTKTITGPDGRAMTVRRSSADKESSQWEEDNEVVRQWAASWGHVIPRPNEHLEGFMY